MFNEKRWDTQVEAPPENPVVEALKRTREMISHGWCQYTGSDDKERVCASTALNRSSFKNHAEFLRCDIDLPRMAFKQAINWENIPGWNDAPGRTKEEVLAACDRAIEIARRAQP